MGIICMNTLIYEHSKYLLALPYTNDLFLLHFSNLWIVFPFGKHFHLYWRETQKNLSSLHRTQKHAQHWSRNTAIKSTHWRMWLNIVNDCFVGVCVFWKRCLLKKSVQIHASSWRGRCCGVAQASFNHLRWCRPHPVYLWVAFEAWPRDDGLVLLCSIKPILVTLWKIQFSPSISRAFKSVVLSRASSLRCRD